MTDYHLRLQGARAGQEAEGSRPASAPPWRGHAAAAAIALACVLYAEALARLSRLTWVGDEDAELALIAGNWLWKRVPVAGVWCQRHGMGEVWLTVPFLAAAGQREPAFLLRNGTFGVLGICACAFLAFELGADLYGAAAAALLLALTPAWTVLSCNGIFNAISSCALAPLSLALWLRGARTRRPWLSLAAALTLGAALWTRSTMAAWILALAAAAAAGALPSPWQELPARRKRAFAAACAALFLWPQAPLVAYYFRRSGLLYEFWTGRVFGQQKSWYYSLSRRLAIRLAQSAELLDARGPRLIVLGALVGAIAVLAARSGRLSRRAALPWILFAGYLFLASLSPTDFRYYHLLPLIPLFTAAVCALAAQAGRANSRRWANALLAALLCWRAGAFVLMVRSDGERPSYDESTGSLALRRLFAFFESRPGARPVFFGEMEDHAFLFSSKGGIAPVLVDSSPGRPLDSDSRWNESFSVRDPMFVFESAGPYLYMRTAFRSQLAKRGLTARVESVIRDRVGAPVYDVYRLQ